MKIGVLALQGDFAEHVTALRKLNIEPVEIRLPAELEKVSGLILPGGESTTIGKLAVAYGLMEPLRSFAKVKPVWGTCAGAIFLSKDAKRDQPLLSVMNITVMRNAFGAQVESFEADLDIPEVINASENSSPIHAIFIRAPIIESIGGEARVLARVSDGRIVAVRENNLLATSFHPELTGDLRFHRYFANMCAGIE